MNIWQIESVLAVAKYLNFTRAAESLCMSQPALSLQIIKLEEELDVKLFERTTRALRLTPAGQEFVETANQISSLIKKTKHDMEQYATLQKGYVIVGTLPIMGYMGIPSLISGFKKAYPGVTIEICEAASDILVQMLENGDIDAAIFTPPYNLKADESNIIVEPMFSDEIVLVTPVNYNLNRKKIITLSEAAAENHILMKSNYGLREILINACEKAGSKLNIVYECEQVESIIGLVAVGLGVAFLNIRIPQHSNEPNIKYIHISPALYRDTILAMRSSSSVSPAIEAFREYTINWAKTRE